MTIVLHEQRNTKSVTLNAPEFKWTKSQVFYYETNFISEFKINLISARRASFFYDTAHWHCCWKVLRWFYLIKKIMACQTPLRSTLNAAIRVVRLEWNRYNSFAVRRQSSCYNNYLCREVGVSSSGPLDTMRRRPSR